VDEWRDVGSSISLHLLCLFCFPPQSRCAREPAVSGCDQASPPPTHPTPSARYLKAVDSHPPANTTISAWLTGTGMRFILLHQPTSSAASHAAATVPSSSIPHHPRAPQTEEAVRQFFTDVFECWCKMSMNPFYRFGDDVRSDVFRVRVVGAGRRWL
jgi:trafficking protein particle complex subunit 2